MSKLLGKVYSPKGKKFRGSVIVDRVDEDKKELHFLDKLPFGTRKRDIMTLEKMDE